MPNARRFLLYAHRGASQSRTENSLEAFAHALDGGANALELDVHATRDGHFVVFHDRDGGRLAGRPERIRDTTLSQLKDWRLGQANVPIPTLEQCLNRFRGTRMSIDLKPNEPVLAASFLRVLQRFECESWVTVASFHHRVISQVRRLGWPGRTALSRYEVVLLRFLPASALLRRRLGGQCAQIPRTVGPVRFDRKALLRRCHLLGLRADYWVVNDPVEALKLIRRGATGLMTDDPEGLAPHIRDLLRPTAPTAP